ncbi:BTAD domain-containing putative transcriptional regulator [Gemmatimonas groenlandica]|uniref:Bacterial transcriptional activator domain-containing protein n=1 Tax=Gemmatimonas groenlandica TaxID=2732249 RepID=A0A6M4IL96_9BACT|nr:BTAD domain-containing putative transcriptional regulator [Gemmatimonas groenlandica]QJR35784.1 hypothetical protein HKW67_09795 [Gemmatimonas groenlandica]
MSLAAPPFADSSVSHNVPGTLSSFVGRKAELDAVRDRLANVRLLTVVGPGGAGKTRLVREVAMAESAWRRFDAVWWVELAPVRSDGDVMSALAAVLGVGGAPGRSLADAVRTALQRQPALIVFDNCEHLIDDVARVVALVLHGTETVRVLATSREPLAVDGEFAWSIPALSLPVSAASERVGPSRITARAAAEFEAVQLFAERVRAVTPHFALSDANAATVVALCQRLDGMPLSLELAAAVVPVLGVDELVSRFDDLLALLSRGKRNADPRHRTLRAVLDWSYDLLADDEQRLLRRLSVFRGAFELEAVEAICADDDSPRARSAVVMALGRLVEQSLVEVRDDDSQSRYRLLETVRQYGAALLRETADEHVVRERHARYFARYAAQREAALFSPARGRTVNQLREILDEIRAALDWCLGADGDISLAVHYGGVLGWFWISGVAWSEGRAIVLRILETHDATGRVDAELPLASQLDVLRLTYPIAGLSYFAGDTDTMLATTARERALREHVEQQTLSAGDRLALLRQAALSEQLRGFALAMRRNAPEGLACMDRSLELAATASDRWLLPVMQMRRALVHYMVGNLHESLDDYSRAISAFRELGEQWFLSLALEGIANVQVALGRTNAALSFAREAATVLVEERDAWFVSRACDTAAWVVANATGGVLATPDASTLAARLLGVAEALRRSCGAGIIGPDVQRDGVMREKLRARMAAAEFEARIADGLHHVLDDALQLMANEVTTLERSLEPGGDAPAVAPVHSPPPPTVRVQLLGRFTLWRDGVELPSRQLPSGKVRELLAYLLVHDVVTKEEIGLELWPEASTAQLRNVFHVTAHHVRRHLGEQPFVSFDRGRYRVLREPGADVRLTCDTDELRVLQQEVQSAVKRRLVVDAEVLDRWALVLASCDGDFLSGDTGDGWMVTAQDRLRVQWADAADGLVQLARIGGRHHELLALCELLVRRDPYRESAHRAYMESLAALGERARALAHYESFSAMLQREFGASPSVETRRVVERLRG